MPILPQTPGQLRKNAMSIFPLSYTLPFLCIAQTATVKLYHETVTPFSVIQSCIMSTIHIPEKLSKQTWLQCPCRHKINCSQCVQSTFKIWFHVFRIKCLPMQHTVSSTNPRNEKLYPRSNSTLLASHHCCTIHTNGHTYFPTKSGFRLESIQKSE